MRLLDSIKPMDPSVPPSDPPSGHVSLGRQGLVLRLATFPEGTWATEVLAQAGSLGLREGFRMIYMGPTVGEIERLLEAWS